MKTKAPIACIAATVLASCGYAPTKSDVDAAYAASEAKAVQDHAAIVRNAPDNSKIIQRVSGNWLGVKVKPLAQEATLPPVFRSNVTLIFPGRVNLRTIAERITKVTGLPVTLKPDVFMPISSFVGGAGSGPVAQPTNGGAPQAGIAPSSIVPINTSDDMELNAIDTPLREVLNQIGSRFGINYTFSETDGIVFSRLVTKTFRIKAPPGDTSLTASLGKGGSSSSTGAGVSFTSNGQVSMNSTFSIWTSMQSVLDTIKTPSVGKYFINQATGTVTITDTKEVVETAQKYIDSENEIMTQQVAVRVELLTVTARDNNELGVNWNAVFTKLSGVVPDWSLSMVAPSSVTSTMTGSFGMSILTPRTEANGVLGKLSGSQAMLNALQGYARITNQQTFSAMTLNRQPVPLAKTTQLSYLARTTPGSNSGLGGSSLPGLEPGLLTTGFLSNILPTILDNNSVILQFSLDSSELKTLGVISTGQGITQQAIQTPEVDAVQTVQRVAMKSGSSLVLTGFERENKRYDQRGLTNNIGLGGSYNGQSTKESIVIIITPIIVDGA